MDRDRNLLFGIFAVQLGKVSPHELVRAGGAWAADPARELAEVLVEMGAMAGQDVRLIQALVDEAIREHAGNPAATLEAFGGPPAVEKSFGGSIVVTDSGAVRALEIAAAPAEDIVILETPGRYSKQREYARGGMGRVLLVHDEQMGRDVALKELLPHAVGSADTTEGQGASPVRMAVPLVARFLREARITGQLEHPAIVPVYELGRRPDGSVYYTMKLVRGRTLSQAIRQAESLQDRLKLLPHFVDLCQAIAYAHSRGVVHRDIKPGNVMVGEFGETVVLDWGLAKVRDAEDLIAEDLAESLRALSMGDSDELLKTAYGQAIGTPAYMAPEQATGQLDEIDERTDVYALGVVLYELLTGKVPFEGTTLKETLERVIKEPARPVADVEPSAPAELGAVCAKAISKSKADRYGTAADLADEVQRFQVGALVQAYQYSPTDRLVRFVSRYRSIVMTGVASVVVLMVVVAASYLRVAQERNDAIAARDDADASKRLAEAASADAERQRDKAMAASRDAEVQASMALEAFQRLTFEVPDRLSHIPEAREELARLLEENADALERLASAQPNRLTAQQYRAASYLGTGTRWTMLGRTGAALDGLQKAREVSEQLVEAEPGNVGYQKMLGDTLNNLGVVQWSRGDSGSAVASFERAIGIWRAAAEDYPDDLELKSDLRRIYDNVAAIYRVQGKHQLALDTYEAARQIAEALYHADRNEITYVRDVAWTYEILGQLHAERDNGAQSEKFYAAGIDLQNHAIQLADGLLEADPTNVEVRGMLAWNHERLANLLFLTGRTEEAIGVQKAGIEIREKLQAADSQFAHLKDELLWDYEQLMKFYRALNRTADAMEVYENVVRLREELHATDPENVEYMAALSWSYGEMAGLHLRSRDIENAIAYYERALSLGSDLMRIDPAHRVYKYDNGNGHATVARLYEGQGDLDRAIEHLEVSLALREELARAEPGNRKYTEAVANARRALERVRARLH